MAMTHRTSAVLLYTTATLGHVVAGVYTLYSMHRMYYMYNGRHSSIKTIMWALNKA